ncbi:uncharacterized protein LOC120644583 [Panicum virgatum]|uniref:DUF4228 domain protein n=1 Tax=Panicum virgatum TaxID=38727 RepID=A0A8T0PQ68_PANVG|nr:uncharacterized protein LOC120644583 [Panicum virgatum]KAG2562442.1 hypothetical protein PVAP13_8KG106402 [Panicum virgatum]
MRQWKSLVPAVHLHAPAPPCFPHPHPPSPCPSPPRDAGDGDEGRHQLSRPPPPEHQQQPKVVRLVGCDGRVRAYPPPVTARDLMQQHPRHLVCRADALLIGERIPAVAPGEELQPGQAYFLLPAHLFRSVLSFVSLASSLLLLLSTTPSSKGAGAPGGGKAAAAPGRPFELCRTAAGALQIKFSDDFLVGGAGAGGDGARRDREREPAAAVLRGDARLAKEYEELVGYGKSRRWAPKLETIEEVAAVAAAGAPKPERRKSRALPFLGRLGSRRRRDACGGAGAVACSG